MLVNLAVWHLGASKLGRAWHAGVCCSRVRLLIVGVELLSVCSGNIRTDVSDVL